MRRVNAVGESGRSPVGKTNVPVRNLVGRGSRLVARLAVRFPISKLFGTAVPKARASPGSQDRRTGAGRRPASVEELVQGSFMGLQRMARTCQYQPSSPTAISATIRPRQSHGYRSCLSTLQATGDHSLLTADRRKSCSTRGTRSRIGSRFANWIVAIRAANMNRLPRLENRPKGSCPLGPNPSGPTRKTLLPSRRYHARTQQLLGTP